MRKLLGFLLLCSLHLPLTTLADVTVLGSSTGTLVASGGTYTAETGADLVVIATNSARLGSSGNGTAPTAISWGSASVSGGQIILGHSTNNTAGTWRSWAGVYYIKAANIPAGSNTLTITWAGANPAANLENTDTNRVVFYSLDGVDQTTPVDAVDAIVQNGDTGTTSWSDTFTVADGTWQVTSLNNASSGNSPTALSGWVRDQSQGLARSAANYHWFATLSSTTTTGGSKTYGATFAAARYGSAAVVSFAPTRMVFNPLSGRGGAASWPLSSGRR